MGWASNFIVNVAMDTSGGGASAVIVTVAMDTGGGGASAAISLEHFFNSLRHYYLGLRNGGGARAPPTGCAISPQEVQGLKDVLVIISTIAEQVSLEGGGQGRGVAT